MPSAPVPVRLGPEQEPELAGLLDRSPVTNLFLRGFLAAHPADRAWWYGLGDPLEAAVLVLPSRLCVPTPSPPALARALGRHLHEQHRPCLLVGPRATCDALWAEWAPSHLPKRWYDQRSYVLSDPPRGEDPRGFRKGVTADLPAVAANAAAMELEDLGTDPLHDPRAHEQVVAERLRSGRTWVVEQDRALVFQVNVGTTHPDGAQLGGTWVPAPSRGRGLGVAGVAATCRHLLRAVPRVTLHVNESNTPAVRCYERVGFVRDEAYRLVVP